MFDFLKNNVVTALALGCPDFSKEFIPKTGMSLKGFQTVLS